MDVRACVLVTESSECLVNTLKASTVGQTGNSRMPLTQRRDRQSFNGVMSTCVILAKEGRGSLLELGYEHERTPRHVWWDKVGFQEKAGFVPPCPGIVDLGRDPFRNIARVVLFGNRLAAPSNAHFGS